MDENIDHESAMKSLIKRIINEDVSTWDAVNEYIELINAYQTKELSEFAVIAKRSQKLGEKVINEGLEQKKKVGMLHLILTLQELGIYFEKEEISTILRAPKIM